MSFASRCAAAAVGTFSMSPRGRSGPDAWCGAKPSAPTMPLPSNAPRTILLPAFDAWRAGGAADVAKASVAKSGTLDWVFAQYRADRRFTALDARTKRNHESGFRLVGHYVLKDGRRLGAMRVHAVTSAIADLVYEKLLVMTETDADGNSVTRERRTTINHAMKSCRRAWNICGRRNPGKMPLANPFAAMGLKSSDRLTPTATYEDLQAFRAKAIEMHLPSLATAALIGMGVAAAGDGYLRHLRCHALSTEGTGRTPSGSSTPRRTRKTGSAYSMTLACRFTPN